MKGKVNLIPSPNIRFHFIEQNPNLYCSPLDVRRTHNFNILDSLKMHTHKKDNLLVDYKFFIVCFHVRGGDDLALNVCMCARTCEHALHDLKMCNFLPNSRTTNAVEPNNHMHYANW